MTFKSLARDASMPGILLVISGGLIFSIQDVIIKYISGSYPVHEIVFFRSLFAILPILAAIRIKGGFYLLRIHSRGFHVVRGTLMFLCYTFYYLAIAVIPLSLTVTLFFCCPLFITVLSVVFLKEKMDKRGWAALAVGFIGILIVMQPDFSDLSLIHYGSFLAVLSGIFYAINAVLTRKYGVHETGASLVFYPMLVYLVFSGIMWSAMGDGRFLTEDNKNMAFLLRQWVVPENRDFFLILVIGFVAAGGTYCLAQAYRISNASVVAPFEYFAIPISVVWGYLFWKEMPGGYQIVGIAMIIAGGIYVLQKK